MVYNVCVFEVNDPLNTAELLLTEHTGDFKYAERQCLQFEHRYGDMEPEREFVVVTIQ